MLDVTKIILYVYIKFNKSYVISQIHDRQYLLNLPIFILSLRLFHIVAEMNNYEIRDRCANIT